MVVVVVILVRDAGGGDTRRGGRDKGGCAGDSRFGGNGILPI